MNVVNLMHRLWRHKFKIVLAVYLLFLWFYCSVFSGSTRVGSARPTCRLEDDISFLAQLCHNYTHGHVSGSFCTTLCEKQELAYLKCMSHKLTSRIILAQWKTGLKVVLKVDSLSTHATSSVDSEVYELYSLSELMESLVTNDVPIPVARRVLSECDKGSDGMFNSQEKMYCWHLVNRDEILIMMSLAGNSGIANLYGTCGNLVAVEYASSLPLEMIPLLKEFRSWELRSKIAIALIEMVESLEKTEYGTLMLCDFQRSNFGIVEVNNSFVAKSIDNDISFFKNDLFRTIQLETVHNCTSNIDCNFLQCEVACENGKCSGKLLNNNLVNLCSRLLSRTELGILKLGFLIDPPSRVRKELTALLYRCARPMAPSHEISTKLAIQIKDLLKRSMQMGYN